MDKKNKNIIIQWQNKDREEDSQNGRNYNYSDGIKELNEILKNQDIDPLNDEKQNPPTIGS